MRKIEASELAKHRLWLASPQFGGNCSTIFARSLADLAQACGHYRLPFDTSFMTNESLITRARNNLCHTFLAHGADHLLFVDADIGFSAQDVMELLILQIQEPKYEIIGGMYKKKALDAGYAVNWDGDVDFQSKEPIEVTGIGTGFMLIHRSVFEKLHGRVQEYVADDGPERAGLIIEQFFQAEIDAASGRYLSEDFWFSKRCLEAGIRTWLCPWMKLRHAGTHIFE